MLKKILLNLQIFWKRIIFVLFSPKQQDFASFETFINIINTKIKLLGDNSSEIDVMAYKKYFDFLETLELREEFTVSTTRDNLLIRGSIFTPIITNDNNDKLIIFCHGVTNNLWSLFYLIHLALQRGYQVVSYDARNHGNSDKNITTLGQIEACDLQDVIDLIKRKCSPTKIGLYGFSMGASTVLFWISYFAGVGNSQVVAAICEAPFDSFAEQLDLFLDSRGFYLKDFLINKIIEKKGIAAREKLLKISPISALQHRLPINLLLIHGKQDQVINWRASENIYQRILKNDLNQGKVDLYYCEYADHGEVPFIGDRIPKAMIWRKKNRPSKFIFQEIFYKFLQKNLS